MNTLSEYRYLTAADAFQQFSMKWLDVQSLQLEQEKQQTEQVILQQQKKMNELAEYGKLHDLWTLAQKIATTLFSSQLIHMGITNISSGGSLFSGGAMIAGGIVHIANHCFSDHGVWEWATRKFAVEKTSQKLATFLPAASSGLLFLYSLYHPNLATTQQFAGFFSKAISFLDTVSHLGKSHNEFLRKDREADLLQGKTTLSALKHEHQEAIRNVEQSIKASKMGTTLNEQMLTNIINSTRRR
jgi:hypothetical protein